MAIPNFERLMEDLRKLRELSSPIALPEIPVAFQPDVLKFIVGETLLKNQNGELLIGDKMLKRWVEKVIHRGFDYDIDLKTYGN